jgi:sulfite reductase (NADPH) hemoprotein beta-component
VREFLPWEHFLTYVEAILRVYNRFGRRDNIHKARIKILVKEMGIDAFREAVEAEWAMLKDGEGTLTEEDVARIEAKFSLPEYAADDATLALPDHVPIAWVRRNVHPHRVPGYAAVTLSLKKTGVPPGDLTAGQMDAVADLAERFSFGELRVTHEQNLVLADVRRGDLPALWHEAKRLGLATANIGLITNIIACPGGDFCSLANARSIPIAESIQRRFDDLDYQFDIGELDLNVSGCMNACGHHHVGHIGILGVDKNGEEWYQVTLGGDQHGRIGTIIGPSFAALEVPGVIERLIEEYLEQRDSEAERFVDVVQRIGVAPFKERVYGHTAEARTDRARHLAAA